MKKSLSLPTRLRTDMEESSGNWYSKPVKKNSSHLYCWWRKILYRAHQIRQWTLNGAIWVQSFTIHLNIILLCANQSLPLSSASVSPHRCPGQAVILHAGPRYFRLLTTMFWLRCTVGFQVLTSVVTRSSAFRDRSPCSPLNDNWSFEVICRLRLRVEE
jgi:hypothetical protein